MEGKEESPEPKDNSIFIGNKPFMNYVTGVVMQFTTKGSDEVIVKARGKFISRAVDVSEVVLFGRLPRAGQEPAAPRVLYVSHAFYFTCVCR